MINVRSHALIFFGATGDLAYKKIFPALQAMIKRGNLDIPVIGVANAGWNVDQLRARAIARKRAVRMYWMLRRQMNYTQLVHMQGSSRAPWCRSKSPLGG
jgi:glucose-6-phosphate 1-dehydrogenase